MRHVTSVVVAAFVVVAAAGAVAFQAGRPWPPPVAPMSSASPVRSPADELKTIVMPPGYHLELVASEPLVQDPVVIDWDSDGRLWVVEMAGYMNDIQAGHEHDPVGRVVVLQDTNGDGAHGQANRLRGRSDPAARAQGARRWRARRRAAAPVVHAGHQPRPQGRQEGRSSPTTTVVSTPTSSTTPTRCCGRSTTGSTPPRSTRSCAGRTARSRSARRWRAGSGARRRTMPDTCSGIPTNRRCTSISCRRITTAATRR